MTDPDNMLALTCSHAESDLGQIKHVLRDGGRKLERKSTWILEVHMKLHTDTNLSSGTN